MGLTSAAHAVPCTYVTAQPLKLATLAPPVIALPPPQQVFAVGMPFYFYL